MSTVTVLARWLRGCFQILLLLITAWSSVSYGDTTKIPVTIYADNSYPPYSYEYQGKARGIYTDVLSTIFSRMTDFNVTIKPIPWKRGLKYLASGTAFALYPPYYRPAERPYIAPYSLPIIAEPIVVACRQSVADKLSTPRWPQDFYGLSFAMNSGFIVARKPFWDAVNAKKITVWHQGDSVRNIKQLLKGRLDCYINGRLVYENLTHRMRQDTPQLFVDGEPIVEVMTIYIEWGHLGFTNQGGDDFPYKDKFIAQFNQQLLKLQQSGEMNRIIENFSLKSMPVSDQ